MTDYIKRLEGALRKYNTPNEWIDMEDYAPINDAATKFLAILPLLEELVEARGKGTQGDWKTGKEITGEDLPYLFAPSATDTMGPVIARFDYSREDRDFIQKAASTITQIAEIIKGEKE